MTSTPDDKPAATSHHEADHGDWDPTPGEVLRLVAQWLRHRLGISVEKPKWTEVVTAVLTVILAIAAIVSAWLFQGQLTEARKTTRISLESFRVDQRAWIEIQPSQPTLKSPASDPFGALFIYNIFPRNVGKTAAYDIVATATRGAPMSALSLGDNADEIASHQRMLQGNHFGMPDDLIFRRVPRMLGPGDVSDAPFDMYGQEPQKGLYQFLIGRVDYSDAFQIQHWVTFCFFIADGKGNIQYCKYGNDTDRNSEVPPEN
jgi:hypothetical protein